MRTMPLPPMPLVPVQEADAQALRAEDGPVPVVKEEAVVLGALHLGEAQHLAPGAQVVDVHQLRVAGAVKRLARAVGQHIGRVHALVRAGDGQLERPAVEADEVPDVRRLRAAGEEDVADLPALQELEDPVVPAQLAHDLHRDAQRGDGGGGAVRGVEGKAQVGELAGQGGDLRLVPAVDADEDAHVLARGRGAASGSPRR